MEYIKCPRCEINYILKKQKLCDICKAELRLAPDKYSEEDEEMILCPICKQNYIFPDEDMCSSCRENEENEIETEPDADEDWRSYLDDEKETPVADDESEEISLSELEEEEDYDDEEDDYGNFGDKFDDYDDNFDDEYDDEEEEEDEE
ncbi:MAG: hypothetical protein IJ938_00465 [Clostridia bacterium]|nr:hypothetical protein [Clostridia bacterium]MBR2159764.1 hypothetical protein [Clostridia bacterium]MBR2496479.1 hypothetical protein [Clostridia bacterium]MBR2874988.1 hypothetical protein [Clostridia bacterium]MBR6693313.1 hypothetical protein [Clostridia bacterium]